VSRRTATIVVSGGLLLGLVLVAALLPVPYVVYGPGPLTDVLGEGDDGPIIEVEGAATYPTDGSLQLTTVAVTSASARMDLLTAMQGWIDPDKAVVPRDIVYPGNPTSEEARQQNAAVFSSSQELASVAALRYLGYDVPAQADQVVVREVLEDGAASGVLEPDDVILEVDGQAVATPADVVDAVSSQEPGDPVEMTVLRGDTTRQLDVPTAESEVDPDRAAIGVVVAPAWELPLEVSIDVPGQIGGSSAGLVFALGIVDTLTPGQLVQGTDVAGTGEITPEGDVGAISGVQQKIAAARDEGAAIFLAPSDNCGGVLDADPGDMLVVPVDSLSAAVDALSDFVAGNLDRLPSCSTAV
jgi:PDZ domain-containing protein